MQIDRLDHLVLTVRDIDASIDFYTRVLGMRAVTFGAGRKALAFGAQKINLHQAGANSNPRPSDLRRGPPTSVSSSPRHSRRWPSNAPAGRGNPRGPGAAHRRRRPILSLYLRDPDLNLIELSNPL